MCDWLGQRWASRQALITPARPDEQIRLVIDVDITFFKVFHTKQAF
jgi:hypothetical protein